MSETYMILSIIGTLVMIGFFAGYEIAFVSANRLSIELKKKQGKKTGLIHRPKFNLVVLVQK